MWIKKIIAEKVKYSYVLNANENVNVSIMMEKLILAIIGIVLIVGEKLRGAENG